MTYYHTNENPGHRIDRLIDKLLDIGGFVPGPLRAHRFGHGDDAVGEGHDDAEADILAQFREQAGDLHDHVVHGHGVFVVEFLGATGSGKTRLIERLIERAPDDEQIGVIVGDVAGDDDASRFRELGVTVSNVNTGKECHLDPSLVEDALDAFDLSELDTLFVENVGNMVCPADFPLGAQLRVLVVSTTEGDDVVRKHPLLVQAVDAAVVNKVDVADALDADVDRMVADVTDVAPDLPAFRTSAKTQVGVDDLEAALSAIRETDPHHAVAGHSHEHTHDHAHGHTHGPNAGDAHDGHAHAHTHDDQHPHAHEPETDPLAPWRPSTDD